MKDLTPQFLFSICVMATCCSAGVRACALASSFAVDPLPRLAGVMCARCLLFGAKTP